MAKLHAYNSRAELVENKLGSREFIRWLTTLTNKVNNDTVPVDGIIWTNLDAGDVAAYFTSGLGNQDGPWAGWAICDGTNGTPDVSSDLPSSITYAAMKLERGG